VGPVLHGRFDVDRLPCLRRPVARPWTIDQPRRRGALYRKAKRPQHLPISGRCRGAGSGL